jgi:hypothetical protein
MPASTLQTLIESYWAGDWTPSSRHRLNRIIPAAL